MENSQNINLPKPVKMAVQFMQSSGMMRSLSDLMEKESFSVMIVASKGKLAMVKVEETRNEDGTISQKFSPLFSL